MSANPLTWRNVTSSVDPDAGYKASAAFSEALRNLGKTVKDETAGYGERLAMAEEPTDMSQPLEKIHEGFVRAGNLAGSYGADPTKFLERGRMAVANKLAFNTEKRAGEAHGWQQAEADHAVKLRQWQEELQNYNTGRGRDLAESKTQAEIAQMKAAAAAQRASTAHSLILNAQATKSQDAISKAEAFMPIAQKAINDLFAKASKAPPGSAQYTKEMSNAGFAAIKYLSEDPEFLKLPYPSQVLVGNWVRSMGNVSEAMTHNANIAKGMADATVAAATKRIEAFKATGGNPNLYPDVDVNRVVGGKDLLLFLKGDPTIKALFDKKDDPTAQAKIRNLELIADALQRREYVFDRGDAAASIKTLINSADPNREVAKFVEAVLTTNAYDNKPISLIAPPTASNDGSSGFKGGTGAVGAKGEPATAKGNNSNNGDIIAYVSRLPVVKGNPESAGVLARLKDLPPLDSLTPAQIAAMPPSQLIQYLPDGVSANTTLRNTRGFPKDYSPFQTMVNVTFGALANSAEAAQRESLGLPPKEGTYQDTESRHDRAMRNYTNIMSRAARLNLSGPPLPKNKLEESIKGAGQK